MGNRFASQLRLKGGAGTLFTTPDAWDELLEAAEQFGWRPARARVLYRADVGLVISSSDAENLATALEVLSRKLGTGEFVVVPDEHRAELLNDVQLFCRFCRGGRFRIC